MLKTHADCRAEVGRALKWRLGAQLAAVHARLIACRVVSPFHFAQPRSTPSTGRYLHKRSPASIHGHHPQSPFEAHAVPTGLIRRASMGRGTVLSLLTSWAETAGT